jgi:anaphase-promoting complex subunit 2
LFEEFRRGKNRLDENDECDDGNDADGDEAEEDRHDIAPMEMKQWQPDPMESSASRSRHRKQDTISMLVNIYGSSELFVNEYRNMLADRLIAITDYDVDKEVRNLELLKLRFDESSLHNCEIMLKDIADSKRTNALIKKGCQDKREELLLDVIIISHIFWPTIKEESITLPDPIKQQFQRYSKEYEHIKRTRQLSCKPHLGSVELVLQFGETCLSFTVSPAHAAIIYMFQDDQTTLHVDTIAIQVGMPKEVVRKKLVYWVNNQILHEISKDTFQLVDRNKDFTSNKPLTTKGMMVEEEEAQTTPSVVAHQEESMSMCENFIIGMLGARGKSTLEVIHTTLGFVLPGYSASLYDLKTFMQKLIQEDKIELDGI